MAALVRLIALGLLAGCGGEGRGPMLPAFAADLPGRTALVVWGDVELSASIQRALDITEKRGALVPCGNAAVQAWQVPAGVQVGWQSLAASRGFREAIAELDPGATGYAYADLEQLVEAARLRRALGPQHERIEGALGFRGLRWAALGFTPAAAGGSGAGILATSGATGGIAGLLTQPARPAAPIVVDPDAWLQVDAIYDPGTLARILESLGVQGSPSIIGGAAAGMMEPLAAIARALGGRASFRVTGTSGALCAAAIADPPALADALDRFVLARMATPAIEGAWLVLRSGTAQPWQAPVGPAVAGPLVHVSLARSPSGSLPVGKLALSLRGAAADRVEISFDWRR